MWPEVGSVGTLVCWCAGAHFASLVPAVGDRSLARSSSPLCAYGTYGTDNEIFEASVLLLLLLLDGIVSFQCSFT